MQNYFTNPILPGFYPDPTICRVDDDYYLVTSSFEIFPALPIFYSKDLVHWQQLGHVLDKKEWLYVNVNHFAGGMMAPTLRYNNGTFYLICCNFADGGNFIMTAKDPAGPWNKPIPLPDVPGIDASIFFDDDGKCYVTSTGQFDFADGTEQGIWGAEFDPQSGKLLSEKKVLWRSALRGAPSSEAPHIYHIGDWYYLITAEGGTEHYHSVVVGRNKEPLGEYISCPHNPIMTHRHLGKSYPIGNPGHADLVQTQNGDWYAVLLASRLVGGFHKNMGRETYLVPVEWEDEWPVFSPGTGKVEFTYPIPDLPESPAPEIQSEIDNFDSDKLDMKWVFWGTPYQDFWKLEDGMLKLKALPHKMASPLKRIDMSVAPEKRYDDNVSCVLRRQCQPNFDACCKLQFDAKDEEAAGLVVLQQCNHQLRVEKRVREICVVLAECSVDCPPFLPSFKDSTQEHILAKYPYESDTVTMRIAADGQDLTVYCNDLLLCHVDGRRINTEDIGPMTGTMIGMFATSNEKESNNQALFDWFRYIEK